MENYTPKIGDVVKITKSPKNWSSLMDRYDGMEVIITGIIYNSSIKFKGCGSWVWCYDDGHFKPVKLLKQSYEIY